MRLPSGLVAGAPVTPDAETARRWATDELANPVYHRGQSLLDRFLTWLVSLFDGASAPDLGVPPAIVAALVVAVVAGIALAAFWLTGPVRLARRASSVVVLGDDSRTAAELRAAADAHAASGDWVSAVLDRFRAVVRSLEERALLDERPGRTAFEAAQAAAAALPDQTDDLRRAGRLFDDVCYGKVTVGADADAWLRTVDAALAAARPRPLADRAVVAPS